MKTKVRKITNVSSGQVQVQVGPFSSIYLGINESLENTEVYNIGVLEGYVKVEYDLSEVVPVNEGLINLNEEA
jgi:hypothetical protein